MENALYCKESELFGQARRQHSAVEVCINLEIRRLDRCLSAFSAITTNSLSTGKRHAVQARMSLF